MAYMVKMVAMFTTTSDEELFMKVVPQVTKEAKTIEGFLWVDFWRNVLSPHVLLEDSFWETKAAANNWREHPFHKRLQSLAYEGMILMNLTTRWEAEGELGRYLKCPVCSHGEWTDEPHSKSTLATGIPYECKDCGFIYPKIPNAIDTTNLPASIPHW